MMKKLLMASVAATAALITQAGAADMAVKAAPRALGRLRLCFLA
jgi:hypothetical protein